MRETGLELGNTCFITLFGIIPHPESALFSGLLSSIVTPCYVELQRRKGISKGIKCDVRRSILCRAFFGTIDLDGLALRHNLRNDIRLLMGYPFLSPLLMIPCFHNLRKGVFKVVKMKLLLDEAGGSTLFFGRTSGLASVVCGKGPCALLVRRAFMLPENACRYW